MRAKLVWAPAPCCATSCTLGFSTLTSPNARGDGGIVCRELGMPIQPLGQVCTGERSELSNQEIGNCSHCSASISILVLPSPAATTAPWVQGNGHLTAENIPHLSGKIREMSPAPRPSPAPIVPGRTMARPSQCYTSAGIPIPHLPCCPAQDPSWSWQPQPGLAWGSGLGQCHCPHLLGLCPSFLPARAWTWWQGPSQRWECCCWSQPS